MSGNWILANPHFGDISQTVHDLIDLLVDGDVIPEDFNDRWIDRPDLGDPGNIH